MEHPHPHAEGAMNARMVADLEQRLEEADAAHLAMLDEQQALLQTQIAFYPKLKASVQTAAEARAAWETARRGGPLEPGAVAADLRRAGLHEPEQLFHFERAGQLAPLPCTVWVRPRTPEGYSMPWAVVRDELLEAGYEVRLAHEKRYRLQGATETRYYQVMEVQRPVLEAHRGG